MTKTAVFGGAFDPVHSQHIGVARACVSELGINRLILVPTANPPHKRGAYAPFENRVEMLKHAFSDFPAEVIISDIEQKTGGIGYAAEILPRLYSEYGDFYYILGGDSLLSLEKWYKPESIVAGFKLAVFNRDGYPNVEEKSRELEWKWGGDICVMRHRGKDTDSHGIRTRLFLGIKPEGLPESVYEYIVGHKLYSSLSDIISRLPDYLTEHRVKHSINTALTAETINHLHRLGLSSMQVLTAGLLHDIGKKYDGKDDALLAIPDDAVGTPVAHQFAGAVIARTDFGLTDEAVLSAIACHTTGKPNMTTLDKLLYTADMISPERCYDGVEVLRAEVKNCFEQGFLRCLEQSYNFLIVGNKDCYPLTLEAINFYKENQ